jgi:hypothetical protein
VLLLNGKMLTGRDAAHKRMVDMLAKGEPLPVDFTGRFIYYVGPVDPVRDEVVGPAGPTTATRMDKFTADAGADRPDRHGRQGRARPGRDRGDQEAQARLPDGGRRRRLPGVEGDPRPRRWSASPTSAWRRSTSSRCRTCRSPSRSIRGTSVHQTGPKEWQAKIGKIPRSQRLANLIRQHAGGVQVDVVACDGWATRVENLRLDDPDFAGEARQHLAPLLAAGVDQIVLGCTHYAFLRPLLEPLVASRATLVDVAEAVARQCARLAGASTNGSGRLTLFATAHPERLQAALPILGLGSLCDRQTQAARLATA